MISSTSRVRAARAFRPVSAGTGFGTNARSGVHATPAKNRTSQKQKERRTKAAPPAPARGLTKQHLADAPLRGRGTSTAFVSFKSP
jgi:hypothetical protein